MPIIFSIKERVYYEHKNTTGKAESRTANLLYA
eukprot:SAG11_NODE_2522_length_3261_cov_1.501265_1_plen_32_part_10